MIPLYLKISGIYSYRDPQEIDFRTLTASHLFGIFGAVGSGKSAILEAILFALYGETERLNNRELRAYNMMNLKSNEAFIQFEFLAPGQKGQFRAVVKGKRNSRNKEDVKFERSLYKMEGISFIPVETSEIQAILGISYDNFRRTIIIPQGKFQEFLQLSATQRTDMVKELFNLQNYDLAFKTGHLQKKNDEAVSNCQGRLQQLGQVTVEEITGKQLELDELILQLSETRIILAEKTTLELALLRISELHASLASNRNALKELDTQKEEIQKAEQRLNDYDDCIRNFKSDFDLLDNKKQQLATDEAKYRKILAELDLTQQQLKETEIIFKNARKAYENRESLQQQAKELELCAKINLHRKTATELVTRIEKGEALYKEASLNLESQKAKAKEFTSLQETLKAQLPDINRLQQAKDWFASDRLLQERLDGQRQKETSLLKEISSFTTGLSTIYDLFSLQLPDLPGNYLHLPHQLGLKKQETENALQQLLQQLLHLEVQDKLKSFASDLKEGNPCPLCGSTEHPHVLLLENIETELKKFKNQKNVLEKQLQLVDNSITRSVMLLENTKKKQAELETMLKGLSEADTALVNHRNNFAWTELTEEKLKEEWIQYTSLHEQVEKLNVQAKEATAIAETELERVNDFSKRLENLRREHMSAEQNAELILSLLRVTDYSIYSAITSEVLNAESEKLKQLFNSIGEEYTAAEKLRNGISAVVENLTGTVGNIKQTIEMLLSAITNQQKQLEARILSSRFGNEKVVREILTTKMDRQEEQERIRKFRDKLVLVSSTIRQLEQQLEGKPYNAGDHEKLKLEISEIKNRIDGNNQRKIAAEIEVARKKKVLEDTGILKAELKILEIRRENLKILSSLFREQGFVNFVSTMHLQNLVAGANERFYRLTRQQLKLELDQENNFRIRDYLNEGQWRNVKTLSGGQTFQASLCLALALADNIQQLNQSGQNFFFLDEGFGTLDRESLEMVFETLKALRRENRVVGVISHVEDLMQEINAFLRITLDDEHGSVVKASWE